MRDRDGLRPCEEDVDQQQAESDGAIYEKNCSGIEAALMHLAGCMMTREEGPLQIYQTESTLFIEKPFNANSPGCYHGRGQTWGFSLSGHFFYI